MKNFHTSIAFSCDTPDDAERVLGRLKNVIQAAVEAGEISESQLETQEETLGTIKVPDAEEVPEDLEFDDIFVAKAERF